jgi:hypothetical protein
LPLRLADFSSLAEALDYAAQVKPDSIFIESGSSMMFSPMRITGKSPHGCPPSLRFGLERGGRVGLVADTDPDSLFFSLPVSTRLGSGTPAGFLHLGGIKLL